MGKKKNSQLQEKKMGLVSFCPKQAVKEVSISTTALGHLQLYQFVSKTTEKKYNQPFSKGVMCSIQGNECHFVCWNVHFPVPNTQEVPGY